MLNAGPTPLALGATLTVAPPNNNVTAVILLNLSPWLASVNIGGPQKWLPAYTADLYQIPSGSEVAVTPITVSAVGIDTGDLAYSWLQPSDNIAGATYPQQLLAQAISAQLSGITEVTDVSTPLLTQAMIASGSNQDLVFTPPAGTRSIVFHEGSLAGSGGGIHQIVGGQTGILYYVGIQDFITGNWPTLVAVATGPLDTTYICVVSSGSSPNSVAALANSFPPPFKNEPFCSMSASATTNNGQATLINTPPNGILYRVESLSFTAPSVAAGWRLFGSYTGNLYAYGALGSNGPEPFVFEIPLLREGLLVATGAAQAITTSCTYTPIPATVTPS